MNNYIKQSKLMKTGRSPSLLQRNHSQSMGGRGNQLNSKNSLENTNADQLEALKVFKPEESIISSHKSLEQITCRICLSELDINEEEVNPIISPCKCSGTMKYIHTQCLKAWLNSKGATNRRNGGEDTISYIWKSLDCELCKTKFPDFVFVNDKKINLIDIERPEGPYIILENVSNNSSRAIHVLGMSNKDIVKIGRGHDSDVRIGDISVSRLHAIIK